MGSIKITLLTRNMANSILHFGIKIYGCRMEPGSIQQGQYLSTPQCNYCSTYHSHSCSAVRPICPNCAGPHYRYQYQSKNRPRCINCKQEHKSTSSHCPVRRKFLTTNPIDDVVLEGLICPYETQGLHQLTPIHLNLQLLRTLGPLCKETRTRTMIYQIKSLLLK